MSGDNFRLFSSLEIPVGQGLSGWVAQTAKPIVNGNPSVEPGYLNDPTKYSTLCSALAVPLEGVSGVVAVLALYRAQQDGFSKDHLRILLAIGSKLGFAIENALKSRIAERSVASDQLTGLANSKSLFLYLDREIGRCARSGLPVGVFLADIDKFKQINDRLGHLQGDKLLQLFAEGLRNSCREYDYPARLGGDEFAIVVPNLRETAAGEIAERLRGIATWAGQNVSADKTVTVTIGQAFYPADGMSAEQLLAAADHRMHNSKAVHNDDDASERLIGVRK